MSDMVLLGRGGQILKIPMATWKKHLTQTPEHSQNRLSFMTEAHYRVRYFVVKELALKQKPLEPEFISMALNIPLAQVTDILEELERKLFFLVRNEQAAVAWAYPVTVETTPHRLNFSTGERLFGA
jgi:hypothetical protein